MLFKMQPPKAPPAARVNSFACALLATPKTTTSRIVSLRILNDKKSLRKRGKYRNKRIWGKSRGSWGSQARFWV